MWKKAEHVELDDGHASTGLCRTPLVFPVTP